MMTGIPPFSFACDFSEAKYAVHVGYCPTTGSWTPGGTWTMREVAQGLKKGLELEIVDPRMEEDGAMFNWTPIRPDTDIAFALGLINVLLKEKLFDHDFVSKYTNGSILIRSDTGLPLKDEKGSYLAWDVTKEKVVPQETAGITPALYGSYRRSGRCPPSSS